MQKILGCIRKANEYYGLIDEGDRIAVAVSGGKDSLVMLQGLAEYRRFAGVNYSFVSITADPCFNGEKGD